MARMFQKGGPGGPGRKPKAVEEAYLRAFVDAFPIGEWRQMITKALHEALNNPDADVRLRYMRWLGEMAVGKASIRGSIAHEETKTNMAEMTTEQLEAIAEEGKSLQKLAEDLEKLQKETHDKPD